MNRDQIILAVEAALVASTELDDDIRVNWFAQIDQSDLPMINIKSGRESLNQRGSINDVWEFDVEIELHEYIADQTIFARTVYARQQLTEERVLSALSAATLPVLMWHIDSVELPEPDTNDDQAVFTINLSITYEKPK